MYKTLVLTQNSQPFPIALGQLELQCDFPGQTHTTLGQQGASLRCEKGQSKGTVTRTQARGCTMIHSPPHQQDRKETKNSTLASPFPWPLSS